jgi:hypothetical protein
MMKAVVQVCLKNEYVIGHDELVKELFIVIKGSLQISVPNSSKGKGNKNFGGGNDPRASRASKKNLLQFRMLEKQGAITGVWNPYDNQLRYPYEVQAKEFTTMLNISRQGLLEIMGIFDQDRPKILATLEKEYELVQTALRFGKGALSASVRNSSARIEEPEPEEDEDVVEHRAQQKAQMLEVKATLEGIQSSVLKAQFEFQAMNSASSKITDILGALGVAPGPSAPLEAPTPNRKKDTAYNQATALRERTQGGIEDEKQEITAASREHRHSAAAAAIVL